MKRFLALFLVCCLIVSALSVPAFAADSIVGRKWSCSTTGKTITVGSSDSLSYVFDASLGMNGFGSSPIENIYSSFPGWSGIKRSTSSLYTLPAGSTISYSVTISVSGFSGFGSSDLKPLGRISVCSVTDSGGWQSSVASSSSITPVISSGAYLYSFSGTVTLKDYVKTYAASLFFVFNLTGRTNNPINGKRLTCTVSSSDIFVKYLAGASSASEDQINSTVNNIYNTVINKPGDLVFFTGTYDCADTVSHVGIYAGDGKMLHCGDPIQYTSIDTSYWQAHFYAFGRLSYNVDLVRPYFVSLHSSSSWDREWSNIYEVYVTDSDGSSINFSMNRDMAVITICQYDYSDSKWWAYTSVSASDNYTLSTASLPVRQYNSEGKPYLICAYIKDSDGVLVCSKPIAVIDPRYYSGTFSQLKFVQTYSCFPGSNIWPSTFYGGVDSE